MMVYSVQSATSLTAFNRNNANNELTVSTASAYTYYAPTLWADLVASVQANPTVASTEGKLSINMTTASVTVNGGAVLLADDYSTIAFGSTGGYRLSVGGGGYLVFRNGGSLTHTGNVGHSFFNGYINCWNGTFTYQSNSPSISGSRQDFFSAGTTSNGISAAILMFAGGGAANATWYLHLEPLAGKFGALSLVNATSTATAGGGNGLVVQFGNGTYDNVTLPNPVSTFGITQLIYVYLARSGGTTVLVNPTIPGSSLKLAGDTAGSAQLIDEVWPDLPAGTLGTITREANIPGNTTVSRIFRYNPGTLFSAPDPVYLRIANNIGTTAINGAVTSATGTNLVWQTFVTGTNVTTNFGPFELTARRKDIEQITSSFTPTSPITYNNPLKTDAYYTTDASAQTGVTVTSGTKTVAIAPGTTLTLDRRYDYLKWWLSQNLSVSNFLAPSGTALGYLSSWSDSVAGASNAGVKLTSTTTAGTVTASGAGVVNHPFIDANGDSYLKFDSIDSWTVYSDAGRLNQLGSGAGATLFRLNYTPGTTYHLTVIAGGTTFLQTVTPASAGETVVSLNTAALLIALTTKVDAKPTLAQIEASTVLAKEATVNTRASQTSVTALGTPAQASALTALATANQTEHDATQFAIALIPAPLNSTQTQAAAADALVAYDAVVPSDLIGLATTSNVTSAQTAIVAEINANEVKIDAVKAETSAIKAKTDALPTQPAAVGSAMTLTGAYDAAKTAPPAAPAIRDDIERAGGMLDTLKKSVQVAVGLSA